MDGAAAGIAVIVAAILFTAAATSGQVFIGGLAILFIGTLLGFLIFNFPPAKIFMGDAGSLPVGFLLAVLTLRTTYYHQAASGHWYPVLIPLISMAVPLYDFVTVTLLRISQGKSPFVGDTQHFSHRLKTTGPHRYPDRPDSLPRHPLHRHRRNLPLPGQPRRCHAYLRSDRYDTGHYRNTGINS